MRIVRCLVSVSASDQTVRLDRAHDQVKGIFVKQYTLRGVPLNAGEPYSRYFILSSLDSNASLATGNVRSISTGEYLLIDGAVTRRDLQYPVRLTGPKDRVQDIQLSLRDEDGGDDQFSDLLLDLAILLDDCPCDKTYGDSFDGIATMNTLPFGRAFP